METRAEAARRGVRGDVVEPGKRRLWQTLGPGLITGAADDDPSGIATYSQAGAQFGFGQAWTLLLTYPLMAAVQDLSARVGRISGRGIAGNLREYYPNWLLQSVVALLFIANTLNIGADLGAMAAAAQLASHRVPGWIYVLVFGAICAIGQIVFKHTRYVAVLKWLSLSLLAYFATLLAVHIPWGQVARGVFVPTLSRGRPFWMSVVAIFGTTISPYLFFWQASQEVEDTKAKPLRLPLLQRPAQAPDALRRIQIDTLAGMAFSNLVALAILVTSGATLYAAGVHHVDSAAAAARALEPLAGRFAFVLFALGILGTGLLSVPVLAGSAAYALGEARRWPVGLARKPLQAKAFYGAIVAATALGGLGNAFAINPITALVWAAVINGIVAVPVMALLMLMSRNRRIVGKFGAPNGQWLLGWAATVAMGVATLVFLMMSVS